LEGWVGGRRWGRGGVGGGNRRERTGGGEKDRKKGGVERREEEKRSIGETEVRGGKEGGRGRAK